MNNIKKSPEDPSQNELVDQGVNKKSTRQRVKEVITLPPAKYGVRRVKIDDYVFRDFDGGY